MGKSWTPDSWKILPAEQQPDWEKSEAYSKVISEISGYPPLVFAGEVRALKQQLGDAAQGNGFLIQGGDCAETFDDFRADSIRDKLKILLQMSVVLTYGASCNVVKLGRIAGQFAKPRSANTETRDGIELPSYRGDAVNDINFNEDSRKQNPKRLLRTYNQSAATLNLLRAFTTGGFADLNKVHVWNQEFIAQSPQGKRYEEIANSIDDALIFMKAVGINSDNTSALKLAEFFTSHEALLLGYEHALTRQDSLTGKWYNCSAHFLWIGDRTRQPNGAHVEFLSGVDNPIGIKVGPTINEEELITLCEKLNPENEWGKLTLISRMGADTVRSKLPPLIKTIKESGQKVLWVCDPMHGNTYKTDNGYKTRHFDTILEELEHFFAIHRAEETIPGGVHFELTGDNVTECLGGAREISDSDLNSRYETACDPRLNNEQSLELAFLVTDLLRNGR
ncbi:MAG TPA: 3-deoxy-7-phosphoheptulonate synthase class II [Candidatus Marinimicrobia bacterium]|jgi:3-deoxy-7-phosphoheptulonate synthase|nr:3-deoxy-7-phosphoheptulonate synthase class II [Candidatus Neomarinimicrobiota bacterium]HIM53616.1 3-deoxy-7-phosphoheptulonate synthase class II [Candidatus Neomarinimicrobiota bacterium]